MSPALIAKLVVAALFVGAMPAPAPAADHAPCSRQCLYDMLDRYLGALQARDAAALPWAPHARNTENNVELRPGDGLWGTITKLGDYRLRFADPQTGEVGFHGVVTETDTSSPVALRLKIESGRIAEVETVVARPQEAGVPFLRSDLTALPELDEIVPAAERVSRARMIALADGYFATLQRNDGTLRTEFTEGCNRRENGMQTTNHPDTPYPSMALGCAAQFQLGFYRYDDRLRARRFPLIDEERGLIMAFAFIDHSGRLGDYQLTDGRPSVSMFRRPHSFYLLETFKIRGGKIQRIEAVFTTVPYGMPSPWLPSPPPELPLPPRPIP